ncbi:MAG: hypothetical protein ACM3PW_11295 [Chlamydiota bacterium]
MRFPTVFAVLSPALLLFAMAPAQAQMSAQKPAVYTYVAQWSVPRAQWGDMAKMQQSDIPALDRLVADGTLTSYGLYESAVHQMKGPTHGNWFQASSMAGIFKALDVLQGSTASNAALLGSGSHQDLLLVSRDYDSHSGNFRNSLLRGLSVTVKPGMEPQFHDAFDRIIRPVLEKLVADGALHGWSYQDQWIVQDPGVVTAVIIANGPEGLDRYIAAINDLLDKNPNAVAPLIAATEPGSRRDFLLRVNAMRQK